MAKRRPSVKYYCTACKSFHMRGKIYTKHNNFDAQKVIQNTLNSKCKFVTEEINVPKAAIQIEDLERDTLIKKIDLLISNHKDQLDNGQVPSLEIPLRWRKNIIYNKSGQCFLGPIRREIRFDDKYQDLKRLIRLSEIVRELLDINKHATKREIFYTDVRLFKDQKFSNIAIEDLAAHLGTFRPNLHIVSAARGHVSGKVKIKSNDGIIDLEQFRTYGWPIYPRFEQTEIIESEAEFILVLEKDAAMMRLTEDRFWEKIPCILLTSQGFPNYSVREFLKKLVTELKIPVFGLADSDPYGLGILMTYAYGGVQSAHETKRLAINNFYWLGVMPKDLDEYLIKNECRLSLQKEDLKRIYYMLKEPPILNHPQLKEQLELTKNLMIKAEIQALSTHGFDFLIEYIIRKIETGDFIKF